ncbi:hypothetical protein, partial [Paraburkholderia aspalathi]|uniref:hypothetical protein n=1 Tax=Paraburkholderia aspalathi TaxID=1324617 RepID=UPI001BA5B93B
MRKHIDGCCQDKIWQVSLSVEIFYVPRSKDSNPSTNKSNSTELSQSFGNIIVSITVKNQSSETILASINAWGTGGDRSPYTLESNGGSSSWDRTDWRGFIVNIVKSTGPVSYFITAPNTVTVYDKYVTNLEGQMLYPTSSYRSPLSLWDAADKGVVNVLESAFTLAIWVKADG